MKRYIHASSDTWIDPAILKDEDFDITGPEMEDVWQKYFAKPEDIVNDELQIFCEPSVRGGDGAMFIFDESGEDRFDEVEVNWYDWCDAEGHMAVESNNAKEYEQKYREYIKKLCGI